MIQLRINLNLKELKILLFSIKIQFWATEDTNKHSIMTVLRYEVFEKQGLFVMTQNYGSRAWYAFANCEIF